MKARNTQAITSRDSQYTAVLTRIFNDQKIKGRVTRRALAPRFLSYDVRLEDPMKLDKAIKLADNLALYSGSQTVVAQRQGGVIRYDFQLPTYNWQEITRDSMKGLDLGMAAGRVPVCFNEAEYHALFAGATKSGKSTTIQSLLCGLASKYQPHEIDLYIVDPHRDYEVFENFAFLAAPIAHEREQIAAVIRHVTNEYNRRKAEGNRGSKPIWLVIDEAQDYICLGSKDEGHTDEVGLVSQLARGAGKFGIKLIIGSQKPTQADLPGILDNLMARYVGKVTKAQHGTHLTGQPGLNVQNLSGSGDFLSVAGSDVTRFQVARPLERHFSALPRISTVPSLPFSASAAVYEDEPAITIEEPQVGRPTESVEPEILAYYMTKYVSIKDAADLLGLGRTVHNRYKGYAAKLQSAMEQLNGKA